MAQDSDSTPVTVWVALGAIPVGVIFFCCPYRISVLAPILISLGLGVLAYIGITAWNKASADSRPHPLSRLLAAVAAVGVIVTVLAVGGLISRFFDDDNYRRFYGDEVTVTVANPDDCEFGRGRRGRHTSNADCDGATWTVGGVQHTGTLSVDSEDVVGKVGPVKIEGYAIGDDASSEARTDPEYDVARIAGVPLWATLAGLALLAAGVAGQKTVPRRP